jgi:hypothetical protein
METPMIPRTYVQWRHCIVELCKQPLTPGYIDARIKALNDPRDETTRKFVKLYGDQQRIKTLQWFDQEKNITQPIKK